VQLIELICENVGGLDSFIEVFNVVVLYTREFDPDLCRFMEVLAPVQMGDLLNESRSTVAYRFHNLMIRNPERC
jgi:hypothetical protein